MTERLSAEPESIARAAAILRAGGLVAFPTETVYGLGARADEEAAARLEMSVSAITSAVYRLRARFRALLFEEVANTVNKPEEVEEELRHLLAALSD